MYFRTAQDYTRYLEHMLMLNNYRVKRQALIAEGFDGPKKYPPESIKTTKRAKGSQLLYCENPRMSLFLCISQLVQAVSPERREKIRDICEASSSRYITMSIQQQFPIQIFLYLFQIFVITDLIQKTQHHKSVIGISK